MIKYQIGDIIKEYGNYYLIEDVDDEEELYYWRLLGSDHEDVDPEIGHIGFHIDDLESIYKVA